MKRYIHSSFIILHSSLKKGSSLRKVIYASFIILHASFLLSSCTDTLFEAQGYVQEGLPATLRIGVQAEQGIRVTRAAAAPTLEETVHSLFVFIFDEDGNKRLGLFINSDQLQNDSQGAYVTVNTTSMNNATVVCIANATESDYAITTEHLQRVGTLAHLQSAWETLDDRSVERMNYFLMTATATQDGSTSIDIAPGANHLDALLQRVDAKVTFNVGLGSQLPDDWENASFLPRQWRVCQVPLNTYLMPHTREDGTPCDYDEGTDENDYFHTEQIPFDTLTRDDATQRYTGGTFTFYMPENLKQPRQSVSDYTQRDAWEGQDDNGFKHFTNANAYSTYVEMTGTLTYSTKDYSMVSADVKLTVHLGHDSETNPNDYLTRRNHLYTYNVGICGIDDILVEVGKDQEDRPGYEGNVVYNNKEIFNLDSHYDRCLLRISPQEVGEGMTWSVRTPFSTGTHDASLAQAESGLEDYRWLKFVINSAHKVSATEYVRYPGDRYYNPDVTDPNALEADDLMDIHQLTRYLMHAKQQDATMADLTLRAPDGSDSIYITAYVDEYLYHEHPQKANLTKEEKLLLWKESVDREDRQMHLIIPLEGSTGGSYSDDLQSSVIRSLYSFNQRSIRTIFDAGNPDLTTAWGLESVMETDYNRNGGRLPVGNIPSSATSTDNGRDNMLKWTADIGLSWNDVIQTSPRYGLETQYHDAAHACLLRNRDLNGDGTIQDNEVRWYLASIDQLTDIFIGEAALDEEARLYPRNAVDRPGGNSVYWHYTSSSYDASDNGPWVLWAEEGASVGSYNDSKPEDKNGSYYAYRCIRNLGIPLDQPGQVPQNLVEVTEDEDGYLIDMSRMNPKARRTSRANGSLPNHTEQEPENRPYVSFHVDKGTYPEPTYEREWGGLKYVLKFTNAQQWSDYQDPDHNPCPAGYRVPNQRELLIMSTRMANDAWLKYTAENWAGTSSSKARYMSQTAFSLDGQSPYNGQRDGFIWDAESEIFMLRNNDTETGYVRCVRDTDL